jgi:hypothetical protein
MTTKVYSKPTSVPKWADSSTNLVEPSEGEKNTGWAYGETHSSPYENWKARLIGQWIKWINERWGDGTNIDNVVQTASLEVNVATVAATNQAAITGRGKGAGGEGGKFYGGSHATSGIGCRGGYFEGGAANTDGDGGDGGVGQGGAGLGPGHKGGDGFAGQGGSPDGRGIYGKANGAAPGVQGDGAGIFSETSINSPGVFGVGASAGGIGVEGSGKGIAPGGFFYNLAGAGYGVVAQGKTTMPTKAALHVYPQAADPASGDVGAIMSTGAAHPEGPGLLKYFRGGAFRNIGVQAWGVAGVVSGGAVSEVIAEGLVITSPNNYDILFTFDKAFSSALQYVVIPHIHVSDLGDFKKVPIMISQLVGSATFRLVDITGAPSYVDLTTLTNALALHVAFVGH